MSITIRNIHFHLIALILLGWLITGCGVRVAPPYNGNLGTEPTNLTPYNQSGIRLGLPPGWKAAQLPVGKTDVKAQFKKEGTSAIMKVYCQGAFVSRTGLPIMPLNLINDVTVSNQRLWPRYSMGGGNFNPEFSAWTGIVEKGGKRVPMNFYIAWKLPSGFRCKYGIWTTVEKQEAAQIEGDFLAIVRSLK